MIKFGGKGALFNESHFGNRGCNLIEGNTWEWSRTFWGVCNGSGENHLGRLLMKVREELIQQKQRIIFQLAETPPMML